MKLNINKMIEDNIITVDISVASLGTASSTSDEENALLSDFPRSIRFSDISFTSNMKKDGTTNDPVVTTEELADDSIVSVSIPDVINKEYPINSEMHIVMKFDVTKIPQSALNTVFTTTESLGKAYAELFANKVQAEISSKLTEIRGLNTAFEGETEVVL